MLAAFIHLFEKLCIVHSGKKKKKKRETNKQMVAIMGWHLLWAIWLDTHGQGEAETQIRKLEEELSLENMWLYTPLPVSGLVTKWESKIITWRL